MVISIKSGEEEKKVQILLNKLSKNLNKEKSIRKNNILKKTFGKVKFHNSKSPLEIQKEIRDEWN